MENCLRSTKVAPRDRYDTNKGLGGTLVQLSGGCQSQTGAPYALSPH